MSMHSSTGGFALWNRPPSSGDLINSDMTLTEAASIKESKELFSLPPKQADWEKQMESVDQKQAELFHFQWKLIREQLATLSRELANSRQELDMLRSTSARQEVRENDMNRLIQVCQSSVEMESQARRAQEEELMRTTNQLKCALEQERTDRTRALQSLENEVELQFKALRQQQSILVESEKSLGSRIESGCLELRGLLDKEMSNCSIKFGELEQEDKMIRQALDKEMSCCGIKFADLEQEDKIIRQGLEKFEKELQEAVEAMELEKTESRSRHGSLSEHMQLEHDKLSNTLQVLDARLEEHREITTQTAAQDRIAWEAKFVRKKSEQKEELTKLREQSTDSLEALEALLRREFKQQFENITEQNNNRDVELRRLSEAFEAKVGRRAFSTQSPSMLSVSENTTPSASMNAPSTSAKVTSAKEKESLSPNLAFAMVRSPTSIRSLSPSSFNIQRATTPMSIATLQATVASQEGATTPKSPGSRSGQPGPLRSPGGPLRSGSPGPARSGSPGPARSGSPGPPRTSSARGIKSPVGVTVAPPSVAPTSPASSKPYSVGVTPWRAPSVGQRDGAASPGVMRSPAPSMAQTDGAATPGMRSPSVPQRAPMQASTKTQPGAYAFRS